MAQLGVRLPKPKQRHTGRRWQSALLLIIMIVLAVLFLLPLAWLLDTALKGPEEMAVYPIQWLPHQWRWSNFIDALTWIPYWNYTQNSLVLATIFSILNTLTSAMVGFAFARLQGWGKQVWLIVMLATIMIPDILTTIPTYVIFANLNLVYTIWPWVLWGLGSSAFMSFLFRQFFSSIPRELEDAAIIDGCGYWHMFWRIFLPLSTPALATSIIFSFVGVWGDFLRPALLLTSDDTTLAVGLSNGYTDIHGHTTFNVLAAGTVIYILPVLIVFFLAQRYFIRGIVTSGLKG